MQTQARSTKRNEEEEGKQSKNIVAQCLLLSVCLLVGCIPNALQIVLRIVFFIAFRLDLTCLLVSVYQQVAM